MGQLHLDRGSFGGPVAFGPGQFWWASWIETGTVLMGQLRLDRDSLSGSVPSFTLYIISN